MRPEIEFRSGSGCICLGIQGSKGAGVHCESVAAALDTLQVSQACFSVQPQLNMSRAQLGPGSTWSSQASFGKNFLHSFLAMGPFLKSRVEVPHMREGRQGCHPLRGFIIALHFPPIYRQPRGSRLAMQAALLQWARERFSKAPLQLIVRDFGLGTKRVLYACFSVCQDYSVSPFPQRPSFLCLCLSRSFFLSLPCFELWS